MWLLDIKSLTITSLLRRKYLSGSIDWIGTNLQIRIFYYSKFRREGEKRVIFTHYFSAFFLVSFLLHSL